MMKDIIVQQCPISQRMQFQRCSSSSFFFAANADFFFRLDIHCNISVTLPQIVNEHSKINAKNEEYVDCDMIQMFGCLNPSSFDAEDIPNKSPLVEHRFCGYL